MFGDRGQSCIPGAYWLSQWINICSAFLHFMRAPKKSYRLVELKVDLDKIQTEMIFTAMFSWYIPVLPKKKVPFELTGGNAKKIEKSKMASRKHIIFESTLLTHGLYKNCYIYFISIEILYVILLYSNIKGTINCI